MARFTLPVIPRLIVSALVEPVDLRCLAEAHPASSLTISHLVCDLLY